MLKPFLLTLMLAVVYLGHQDFWNWKRIDPMIFGFLPIGLAYHVGYSIVAAFAMVILVRFAWPKHLDEDAEPTPNKSKESL